MNIFSVVLFYYFVLFLLYLGWQTLLWQRLESTKTPASSTESSNDDKKKLRKARTPVGQLDDSWETKSNKVEPTKAESDSPTETDPYAPFPDNRNPVTGEIGGPRGPEPTRYGDWERKGRISDF